MKNVQNSYTLGNPVVSLNYAPVLNWIKNVGLFVLAPFIGLAYLLTFPIVGFGAMLYVLYKNSPAAKLVMNVVATPFITIAFVLFGPILAVGLAVYFGFLAMIKEPFAK